MNRSDKHLLRGLEEFARLADSSEARARFKAQWPGFFPESFWNRGIRQKPPSVSISGPAPQLPVVPMWRGYQDVLLKAWKHGFTLSDMVRLIVAPVSQEFDALSSVQEAPYQRAVLLLGLEPWRARFCSECGAPFAAEKGASKFCSAACYAESRLNTKKRWWAEQGSERRRQSQRRTKREGRKSA